MNTNQNPTTNKRRRRIAAVGLGFGSIVGASVLAAPAQASTVDRCMSCACHAEELSVPSGNVATNPDTVARRPETALFLGC